MTPQEAMDRADEIQAETVYRLQLAREARAAGAEQGRQAAITDPALGREVGFDVGFGARQDARGFVHALMEGFAEGTAARHELAELLTSEPAEVAEAGG